MFESAKTIINNYYTYIINNPTPPIGNTVDTPATPEREPVVRTFLPVDLSANVKMDIEEVKMDDVKKAQRLDWVKRYMKDAQLYESIQILYDWTKN